jgi:hypothetical protein
MENSEILKQFQITLYENEILITTPSNNKEAFQSKINVQKDIKIGWHDWIETEASALNYNECCGVLILFGIKPPTFLELYGLLSL